MGEARQLATLWRTRGSDRSIDRPWRRPTRREWLLFALQVILVSMVQVSNDVIRGNLAPPSTAEAIQNADRLVHFERIHGFFVEPGLQLYFLQTHHFLGITLTWETVERYSNIVYGAAHIFMTLGVAIWVFVRHRQQFAAFRDITFFTSVAAFIGYEVYPLAPPRLTPGLTYNGHRFIFDDTMRHIIGTGTLNGTPVGYNAYSAMPSLHVAWALIMGITILLLSRNLIARALGVLYPFAMTFATVVTSNHYFMDVIMAAVCVVVAMIVVAGYRLVLPMLWSSCSRRFATRL